jgi:glycerol kinase
VPSSSTAARRSPAYREFEQHFPRPGWVEHDATEIWTSPWSPSPTASSTDLEQPVAAIGITDQRETVVAWSRRTGEPYGTAIVWQDRRTASRCDDLAAEGAPRR